MMSKSYMNGGGGVEKWSKILNFLAYVRVYVREEVLKTTPPLHFSTFLHTDGTDES